MRVTLVNKYYPPHLGGIEYHLRDLAEGLAARSGFEPEVVVANEGRESRFEVVGGVPVLRLSRLLAYASTPIAPALPRTLWRLSRGGARFPGDGPPGAREQRSAGGDGSPAAAGRPLAATDLFHLHFPYPWGEFSWLLAGGRTPTVMTYHSDIVRQERLLALYRPLLRRILERVDLIIASSPNMVEHSELLRPVAGKCRVVPFGIDAERYAASPALLARAAELRGQRRRPVVLFVGRLIYYKGVDVLLRALADVPADLVLVGRGPLEADLRSLAAELGLADRLTVLPFLDESELAAWYHAADVFCLPSVARSEAFGLVQLEAQGAGTPVVSTRLTTGVPFVNLDGVTGLTVPPGDAVALAGALNRLLGDEELRRRLGRQAQERVRAEFSKERMITGTIGVYEEARALRRAVARGGSGERPPSAPVGPPPAGGDRP